MGLGPSVPIKLDYRCERCMKLFLMPPKQMEKLWTLFLSFDREGKFTITMDDFFERIIKYPRTALTDAMFNLIDSKNDVTLTFGEFVECVCTFACFEKLELLRYFFFILDAQKTGLVEKNEVKHFVQTIWLHGGNSNLIEAMDYLEKLDDGDGTFTFNEILMLQSKYPNTFYPIYRLQIHIIENILGEYFWTNHKALLIETKEKRKQDELSAIQKRQKEASAKEESANDEMVMRRMGRFKYYCMPWLRKKERLRIAKIAAIEQELDDFKNGERDNDNKSVDSGED